MKRKNGWYHDADFCSKNADTRIVYCEGDACWYMLGPFKTHQDAKKNAIDYFHANIREIERKIAVLREIKGPPKNKGRSK